ncbi:MAG TPA: DUF3592 domain-containing protein [Streptosporangiaceae bacterium]|nr:DUF3592 domain-containing protein [Streptosporangiaceae bacterium]
MQQKQWYIVRTVTGVIAAGAGGIFGIILLLDAVGVTHGSASKAHYALQAVLALAIGVVGAVLAISSEHQWHHLPGGPSAWAANEGWRTSGQGSGSGSGWGAGRLQLVGQGSGSGRRGLHAPGAVAFQALLFLGITIFLIVSTLQSYSGAQQSSYTQAHGVSETAVADNVQVITNRGSHGSVSYTSDITVTVQHPIVGNGSATVYSQGGTSVTQGSTLTVLVDPRQPSYAEIPGSPYDTTSGWIVSLLFTIVFGIVAGLISRRAVLMILRHRRVSAMGAVRS